MYLGNIGFKSCELLVVKGHFKASRNPENFLVFTVVC